MREFDALARDNRKTMVWLAVVALIAVILFLIWMSPAEAQSRACADHSTVVDRLASGYGETRQTIAISSDNTVFETFASIETGSWTITVTQPGGPTCMIAFGQAFQLTPNDAKPAPISYARTLYDAH